MNRNLFFVIGILFINCINDKARLIQNKSFSNKIIFNKRILSEKLGQSLKECGVIKGENIFNILKIFKHEFDIFSFYSSLNTNYNLIQILKKNKRFKKLSRKQKLSFIKTLKQKTENYYKRLLTTGYINKEDNYIHNDLLASIYNYYNQEDYVDFLDDDNYKFPDDIYERATLIFCGNNKDKFNIPDYILNNDDFFLIVVEVHYYI
ncbi:MAG: hypothetical protein GY830_04840 [Bacteroidetes bacterium]|nr:hypothetical protein [Bacteroidota bacterium]